MPFLIVNDGHEVDQVVETAALAKREARDLRAMGCRVSIIEMPSWEAADAFEETLRETGSMAKAKRAGALGVAS